MCVRACVFKGGVYSRWMRRQNVCVRVQGPCVYIFNVCVCVCACARANPDAFGKNVYTFVRGAERDRSSVVLTVS